MTFIVTPNLEVPVKRLKQWKCSSRLRQEKYKLIDESAFFSEAHETNILTKCHKNGFIGAAIQAFISHQLSREATMEDLQTYGQGNKE